eukprot:TRINITY_DN52513_c0_g1_i2.p1 TRINITY_DN52513_c0_g1~~TRINITY_DN52513_c0_g1_i2.p1  ORF type:complete len:229 (-),score=18.27 TRINITY_DN52513_c0_g1_i2:90-776(-)
MDRTQTPILWGKPTTNYGHLSTMKIAGEYYIDVKIADNRRPIKITQPDFINTAELVVHLTNPTDAVWTETCGGWDSQCVPGFSCLPDVNDLRLFKCQPAEGYPLLLLGQQCLRTVECAPGLACGPDLEALAFKTCQWADTVVSTCASGDEGTRLCWGVWTDTDNAQGVGVCGANNWCNRLAVDCQFASTITADNQCMRPGQEHADVLNECVLCGGDRVSSACALDDGC